MRVKMSPLMNAKDICDGIVVVHRFKSNRSPIIFLGKNWISN